MEIRRTTESDPHDTWAPILLPTDKFYQLNVPLHTITHLTQAIDSLGFPLTTFWPITLKVAEAMSQGADTARKAGAIAQYARIPRKNVYVHLDDLHTLFGPDEPEPVLIDRLFREQFLSFRPRLQSIQRSALINSILEVGLRSEDNLTGWERDQLYRALGCRRNMSAAVRRAYELGIRKPLGIPGGRSIGFLLTELERPTRYYPNTPLTNTVEDGPWSVTKKALRGDLQTLIQPSASIELPPAQLAIASLVALGCSYREVGRRLSLKPRSVETIFTSVASNISKNRVVGRTGIVEWLFRNDIFFAVPHLATSAANGRTDGQ